MTPSLPRVDDAIDPGRSFWLDHVHYPWPHAIAEIADDAGLLWRIAYVDAYTGSGARESAPTLVLLHGRGMNSGCWGSLIDLPVAAGWRVVSLDWSHSGKSLPLNLDRPVARSLEKARDMVHRLVVGHLGIERACYLGHSLGGQLAGGYALKYPQHVEKLILYAPAGLEPLPRIMVNDLWLNDPALGESYETFRATWAAAGILPRIGNTAAEIENAYYTPRKPGTAPYTVRGNPLGDAIVAMRVAAQKGNAAEWSRYEACHAWDVYSSYIECPADDAECLPLRLARLPMPTRLAIGTMESVYPMMGSGHRSMIDDVTEPLQARARAGKAPFEVRFYEGAGHFIHVDMGESFTRDVIEFLT